MYPYRSGITEVEQYTGEVLDLRLKDRNTDGDDIS